MIEKTLWDSSNIETSTKNLREGTSPLQGRSVYSLRDEGGKVGRRGKKRILSLSTKQGGGGGWGSLLLMTKRLEFPDRGGGGGVLPLPIRGKREGVGLLYIRKVWKKRGRGGEKREFSRRKGRSGKGKGEVKEGVGLAEEGKKVHKARGKKL